MLAVFTNDAGRVLVAERMNPRGAWQFPQGGIDPGETPEAAVQREMREELGCTDVQIVKRTDSAIRYHFPPDLRGPIAKKFKGQDQVWFLLRFAPHSPANLAAAVDKELTALEWVTPAEALRRIAPFKREAYVQGLDQLGLLPAPKGA